MSWQGLQISSKPALQTLALLAPLAWPDVKGPWLHLPFGGLAWAWKWKRWLGSWVSGDLVCSVSNLFSRGPAVLIELIRRDTQDRYMGCIRMTHTALCDGFADPLFIIIQSILKSSPAPQKRCWLKSMASIPVWSWYKSLANRPISSTLFWLNHNANW